MKTDWIERYRLDAHMVMTMHMSHMVTHISRMKIVMVLMPMFMPMPFIHVIMFWVSQV
ncbi:hypothetical protein AB1K89_14010 [Sporosarcina sp. 179-K 8C2 HS]|uniref:hypothetical protein n=1 Tax=Sporosarcina sp. 179-K 8C2 HS TaxID=3142387 RepID=UPI0039A0A0C3